MHSMGKTIAELYAMLKLHEKGILKKAKTPTVLSIREGKIQKDKKKLLGAKGKDKGKNKLAYAPKPKIPLPPKRDNPAKDFVCHHCKEVGHWRRNCSSYQAELKKRKNASVASTSGIFAIELHDFPNKTWVYDTGCGTHICNTLQGLRESRKLKHGALSLYMGNGMRAAVEAIGSFDLTLPTGLIIVLDNCQFAPSVIRGVVLIFRLGYALEYVARILNMVPTKKVDRTPYEIWHGKASKLSYLRETIGYYFYNPLENKIFIARNPEFFENSLTLQEASRSHGLLKARRSNSGLKLIQEDDTQPYENTSKRHDEVKPTEVEPIHELGDLNKLPNYKSALLDLKSDKWLDAMNTEMKSMKDNQVWSLVDLPPNGRTVRSKWIFKKNTDIDGNVHTIKARLVANGYTQTYRVDYGETFSPVADIRAIRILLAIAAFYDYEIWQMDVKTAFLNGHLSEDVYMVQPEVFVDPIIPAKYAKLQHSIYRLKQASKRWNKRFDMEIKKIGFTQNPDEPYVYLKASGSNVAFLVLYVDDILIMGNNVTMLQDVKSWLCKCFSMKDLGEAAYILGIKIIRDRPKRLISLSQSAYFDKILKKFKMENSKLGSVPMQEKPDYRKSQGAQTPSEQNPGEVHWTTVKTILKYLRNTKDMVLVYGGRPKTELKVTCYADAGFQTDKDYTKSQSGYVFVLNGRAVDWKSAKQSTIAMSSTEAEYIATAEVSMEAVWMRKFIDGLGDVMPSNKRPMEMLCDNTPAIAIANDPGIIKGVRYY
ncbi:retrotransposon protein, putative, ty1-copia subclass [Tanacetum coccineum]